MIARQITYNKLKDAVRIAFENDKAIYDYYDPTVTVKSLDDIVINVTYKLAEGELIYMGVFEKHELIGYFAYNKQRKILISFALNIEYRQRSYLNEFFKLIRKELGKFECFLFNKNVRAIKYLIKQGMELIAGNHLITKLIYK